MKFVLGTSSLDLTDSQSGLIGLSPPNTGYWVYNNDFLVTTLFKSGAVDDNVFSLYIDLDSGDS